MIAPRSKLLFWVAVVVLPFALAAGVSPAAAPWSLGVIGVFLGAAVLDAFLAPRGLRGISVVLPELVRLAKDRESKLEVRLRNPRQHLRALKLAVDWPAEIVPDLEVVEVLLPAGAEWSTLEVLFVPAHRGAYFIQSIYIEAGSPLGWWAVRSRLEVTCELRVYPNLLRDRNDLAALFLNRGILGIHSHRQVGKGRDFEKLRDYTPGDSFDEVHWKASARRGRPITKVFQVERAQEVYVVIDASRLSARDSHRSALSGTPSTPAAAAAAGPQSDLERYISAALVLGMAAEKQGDLFGVVAFSDKIDRFVRARPGSSHQATCRDVLYTLQSKAVTPDFEEAFAFLRHRLRRRALLIFLTALDDPALAESFTRDLELIRRQHVVLVNMPQPVGAVPLFSDPAVAESDDIYRHLGGHLRWHDLRELEIVLRRRGVSFSLLKNERLSAEVVSQYLGVKQRQLV